MSQDSKRTAPRRHTFPSSSLLFCFSPGDDGSLVCAVSIMRGCFSDQRRKSGSNLKWMTRNLSDIQNLWTGKT